MGLRRLTRAVQVCHFGTKPLPRVHCQYEIAIIQLFFPMRSLFRRGRGTFAPKPTHSAQFTFQRSNALTLRRPLPTLPGTSKARLRRSTS